MESKPLSNPKFLQSTFKDSHFTYRSALRHLKELHFQEIKQKYPDFPFYKIPNFSANEKFGLLNCVLRFLRLKGFECSYKISYLQAYKDSKYLAIIFVNAATNINEIEEQLRFKAAVDYIDGISLEVTSFAQFLEWFYTTVEDLS